MALLCRLLLPIVFLAFACFPAWADKRVALVVANGAYRNAPLANPAIDAELVAASLKSMHFEVRLAKDVDLGGFDDALQAFQDEARGADIALFYFAGHGFALKDGIQTRSYLMSISADVTSPKDVVIQAGGLALDSIMERLNGQARMTLVFIDACRKGASGRGGGDGRGFARFDVGIARQVFVGMSTRLGSIAGDGDAGEGSPFARAFAAKMPIPGQRLDDVFRDIRDAVSVETRGSQVPDAVQDDLPKGAVVLVAPVPELPVSVSSASARDYAKYRVIGSTSLDLMAGWGDTAVLLSPDGDRLLHIDTSNLCLLVPEKEGTWSKVRCIERKRDLSLFGPEDAIWSPHGGRLVMPTLAAGLRYFEDTDIRVLDPATLGIANLTDDGTDSGLLNIRVAANLDLGARWIGDDRIAFLRYPIAASGSISRTQPQLLTIKAAGGEPAVLAPLLPGSSFPVYLLAVSADGARLAYSYTDSHIPGVAGIYVVEIASGATRRIAAMADVGKPPSGMAFSADGTFLLLLGATESLGGLDARALELATGKIVPVDAASTITGVAWSPTGAALAYIATDRNKAGEPAGLFLAPRPGAPGRRLLQGAFLPPVCCGNLPFAWAANDTMILGNGENHQASLLVRLGE